MFRSVSVGLKYGGTAFLFSYLYALLLKHCGIETEEYKHSALIMLENGDLSVYKKTIQALTAVFIVPVVEEFVFRYLWQGKLTAVQHSLKTEIIANGKEISFVHSLLLDTKSAIILVAAVFTLCHSIPVWYPAIFCVSLCFSYAYLKSGKIIAPITAHIFFNLVPVIAALTNTK